MRLHSVVFWPQFLLEMVPFAGEMQPLLPVTSSLQHTCFSSLTCRYIEKVTVANADHWQNRATSVVSLGPNNEDSVAALLNGVDAGVQILKTRGLDKGTKPCCIVLREYQ